MTGRRAAFLILLAFGAAAAGGCTLADTGAFDRLQDEVEGMKRDMAALRASPRAAGPAAAPGAAPLTGDETPSLRKSLADLSAENDRVRSEVLALSTNAEETKVAMQREVSRLNEANADLGQSLAAVRGKVARLDDLERRTSSLEDRIAKMSAATAGAAAAPAAAPAEWKTPEEMYDYALGLIRGGDGRRGRDVLSAFAAKYPGHKLMPNVHYWKGEAFFAEKDYESAILAFQDVVDKYPGGDKAPDAMYKQALSFQALKDTKNARIVLELLASKYPKSPAAEKARQKLTELK